MSKPLGAAVIFLFVVMLGMTGYLWWRGEEQFRELSGQINTLYGSSTPAPSGEAALPADFRTIATITPTEGMTFEYRCRGDVRQGNPEDADTSYCIGIYRLMLVTQLGEKTLEVGYAERPADAPLFSAAQLLAQARGPARVILSFAGGGCRLDEDYCGAGGPENFVTGHYNTDSGAYAALRNFPVSGEPIWSAQGTQALFLPTTCGGAGCMAAPIRVYNIETDMVRDLTLEQGAEIAGAKDVSGDALPYWKNLHWSGPSEFEVTLVGTDGRETTVGGPVAY